jgi:hypothetical protein
MQGPIEVEIKVHVINDDDMRGVATIGMGCGIIPTEQAIRERMEAFAASDECPSGFRLQTKSEYWETVCAEKFGTRFAMPGGEEFDK